MKLGTLFYDLEMSVITGVDDVLMMPQMKIKFSKIEFFVSRRLWLSLVFPYTIFFLFQASLRGQGVTLIHFA